MEMQLYDLHDRTKKEEEISSDFRILLENFSKQHDLDRFGLAKMLIRYGILNCVGVNYETLKLTIVSMINSLEELDKEDNVKK